MESIAPEDASVCREAVKEIKRLRAIISNTYQTLYELPELGRVYMEEDAARLDIGVIEICDSLDSEIEKYKTEADRKEKEHETSNTAITKG